MSEENKFDDLLYESGLTASGCWEWLDDYAKDAIMKYGELIVKECMAMCQTSVGNADYNTGRLHCLENIKEHFGVDE